MPTNPYINNDNGNVFGKKRWNGTSWEWDTMSTDEMYRRRLEQSLAEGYNWWDALFGTQKKRDYEMAQELHVQDYQNKYNSEEERFKRLTELGVNSNFAAESVAGAVGAGAQSGGASVASTQPSESLSGLAGTAMEGLNALSQAHERESLLQANKDNLLNDALLKLKDIGFKDLQIQGLGIALKYMDEKEALNVATLVANLDNICMQYDVMQQNIEESKSRIKEIDAQIALYRSQGDLADAQKLQADKTTELLSQQKLELEWYNNIRQMYGIDLKSPIEANLLHLGVSRSPNYESAATVVYNYYYGVDSSKYLAQTHFKLPSNAVEAAAQNATRIIDMVGSSLKEGEVNLNVDSGVYRSRSYDYNAMMDIFVPLVGGDSGKIESALVRMSVDYGYSKDDVFKFFDEWIKNGKQKSK